MAQRMTRAERLEILNKASRYVRVMEEACAYVYANEPPMREPESVVRVCRPVIEAATGNGQEGFFVVLLNTKNRMVCPPIEVSRGTIDSCPVHPSQIFKPAIVHNSCSIILLHNHPSGDPTPSQEDIGITRRLLEAGRILGLRVVDHLILGSVGPVCPAGYVSLRERNLVAFE